METFLAQAADPIGMIGVAFTLLAYFLLQINRISSKGIWYSALNMIGAVCVVYSLIFNWNTPAILMEGIWAIISLWGVIQSLRPIPRALAA